MNQKQTHEEILDQENEDEIKQLKQSLPKASFMGSKLQLVQYQGFWYPPNVHINNIIAFQTHFQARDADLIITSYPKTGTTWLKSLLFAVVNRAHHHNPSPLLAHHPHELVHHLEDGVYGEAEGRSYPRPHHLEELPSPRLFDTHLSYISLPESIKSSKCKIMYISRNPLDTFISLWHFYPDAIRKQTGEANYEPPQIDDYFEECYQGRTSYGPFLDHVLGYWKQSLERPEKVLFLKYEDLKEDTGLELKRLAEFVGMPFSDEEKKGVVKEIIEMCSISNLKELEVNKSGVHNKYFDKKSFFRKGEVGDWINYFTPDMAERMNQLMVEKFKGTGLSFKLLPQ